MKLVKSNKEMEMPQPTTKQKQGGIPRQTTFTVVELDRIDFWRLKNGRSEFMDTTRALWRALMEGDIDTKVLEGRTGLDYKPRRAAK